MAIVQISKIQHRYGNLIDLPQLDNAELGYATDQKRLFIGTAETGPDENVEVLTSYSQISFSQIDGAGANLNVDTANLVNGQIMGYDGTDWVNKGGTVGGLITLGNVNDIKIDGGSAGFVLETDGTGNLNWTPKNVITSYISNVTQANPAVVTTTSNNFFINGSYILFTDLDGMTELNGNSYYAKILTASTFELYTDSTLTLPLDSTTFGAYTGNGRAISSLSGGGSGAAGGANTNIQINYNGIVYGVSTFSYDFATSFLTLSGNASISGNISVGNVAVAGNISAGGNIVVTGNGTVNTLTATALVGTAPFTVSSNTKVANLNVDLLDGYDTSVSATANTVAVRDSLGNLEAAWFIGDGSSLTNINGANVFGQVANALVAGTVYLPNQPNITSTGVLANLSVAGTITSNGNITAPFVLANIIGNVSGNIVVNGSNTNVLFNDDGNANATGGFTFDKVSNAVTISGNLTAANISVQSDISVAGVSNLGAVSNVRISGGSSNDLITTNGSGLLSFTSRSSIYSNSNVASYLPTYYGTVGVNNITTGASGTSGTITGTWTLTSGSTLQATYADLAEYYEADQVYEPGTVLMFGGEKEVTLASDGTTKVAGVVSTSPAYVMNAQCDGVAVPVALQGRVPVKVKGHVYKGDMMVSAGDGYARPWNNPQLGTVIGKSLENFEGIEGVIEIAVGRL